MTDEETSAPSTMPTIEQTGFQLESSSEPVSIPATSSSPATYGLQLVISSRSPTLVVNSESMITNPNSLIASTLVFIKIPLHLSSVLSVPLAVVPVTTSTIVTTKLPETFPSKLTHSPGVIEVEKEFMVEIIDAFYKSLKRCISLVLSQ